MLFIFQIVSSDNYIHIAPTSGYTTWSKDNFLTMVLASVSSVDCAPYTLLVVLWHIQYLFICSNIYYMNNYIHIVFEVGIQNKGHGVSIEFTNDPQSTCGAYLCHTTWELIPMPKIIDTCWKYVVDFVVLYGQGYMIF
jgi:hypothetical protein